MITDAHATRKLSNVIACVRSIFSQLRLPNSQGQYLCQSSLGMARTIVFVGNSLAERMDHHNFL